MAISSTRRADGLSVCTLCCLPTQQTRHIYPMLNQCWANVVDGGPTLVQCWIDVLCLLPSGLLVSCTRAAMNVQVYAFSMLVAHTTYSEGARGGGRVGLGIRLLGYYAG